ncbi:MAG TPA: M48 family metallopeptidase [Vitreimonas sp.]|uniref:M48 family metallopeptidase n=1 Tax=Vitreimonas sp. TaxID=3069702 RepID=UPI002D25476F|nr:M48 family metallopeptidase [Vitreimonas sp.]HYD86850.1 M48 family metallopeptidase [Vitreimonas sp.]
MWETRYADGRAAVTHQASVEFGADALTLRVSETQHTWSYADLLRADDGSGRVILKRKPDTGERLYLSEQDGERLQLAEPALFGRGAFGIEGRATLTGLAVAAWSLAAVFLLAVPMGAGPIADYVPPRYRDQIAEISWSQMNAFTSYCDDSDQASQILNDLAYRMMTVSGVPMRDDVWITIVDAPFPNAFALPDNSIVVTDDLIALAEHPDELTGVIAHEIAHIEHNHIMKNIIRSVGAGIFFDVVFGGAGAGQMVAIASVNLASLRYSRGDETDADLRGLDYLDAAAIDAGGLARFFERIENEVEPAEGAEAIPTMLSSHPATAERAAAARARARQGLQPSMSDADWQIVRAACAGGLDIQTEQAPATPTTPADAPAPTQPAPAPNPDVATKPE